MTSASPATIASWAYPIALAEDEQAVVIVDLIPSSRNRWATRSVIASGRWFSIFVGRGLPAFRCRSYCASESSRPEVPPPRMTPIRRGSSRDRSRPDWSIASRAAASPMRSARDVRRASAAVRKPSGISRTCAAVCVRYADGSKSEKGRIPQVPARSALQKSGTFVPIEVTAPRPVTTTRRGLLIESAILTAAAAFAARTGGRNVAPLRNNAGNPEDRSEL
jgi:hypothetical protein